MFFLFRCYDARDAHKIAQINRLLPIGWYFTGAARYQMISTLGEGAYGTVGKFIRLNDLKSVAIKIVKTDCFRNGLANLEVAALRKLKLYKSERYNLVQFYNVLTDGQKLCLEFEHLDKNLYEFMKERQFRPLALKSVRAITQQIAKALDHLKSVRLIHADLKLENVMLVNHQKQPYRVKVIDFSLACDTSAASMGSYIQSRSYRSPEIILGAPFTEAIDVWSLGCIAANLYLGSMLYPGENEYEVMRYIVETQGQPPGKILDSGLKTAFYFDTQLYFTTSTWKLKTPEQFVSETGIKFTEKRMMKLTSLDDLKNLWFTRHQNYTSKSAEICDLLVFIELLKGMLQLDPEKRMTPSQVLQHDFTTLRHILRLYPYSFQSLQQPSSRTSHPTQQNQPCPLAEHSIQVRRHSHSRTTCPPLQNHPCPSSMRYSPYSRTTHLAEQNHPCLPVLHHCCCFRTICPHHHNHPAVCYCLYFRTTHPPQQ
ncbi:homeodomain-interacting protein kinase 1-like isoform X2 [Neolamprologus brichardi]|uniref:homeodomain-interacting protein kinase 1-like isoform X2 n=1 Tax=Neolamprologus brichardi TaxID=32507 RepID=UPI001643B1DF|nr:homeodomain-interacting protein kinase 1-like isoform X2 [Neolamprologus brichardi]